MAKLSLFALCALLAAPSWQGTSALIPFADFDAGEHSYSLTFVIDHTDYSEFYYGQMHTTPLKIFDDIVNRCSRLGDITSPASRGTNQMLVATNYQTKGVDFIHTDSIDYDDRMQACIQNIGNPSIQRHFEAFPGAKAEIDLEKEIAQTVKQEATMQTMQSKGTAIRVELGLVVWVAAGTFIGWFV